MANSEVKRTKWPLFKNTEVPEIIWTVDTNPKE